MSPKSGGGSKRRLAEQLRDDAARNLLLSVALIAEGLLAGFVHPENALVVVGLLLAIGLAVFCADWISRARFLDFIERSAAAHRDDLPAALIGSPRGPTITARPSPALLQEDVLQLEGAAYENVWIYAYALRWEKEDDSFTDVVKANMRRGVRYRYLVPGGDRMLVRIRDLVRRYSDVDGAERYLEFRIRPDTNRLVQFGITLYDPEPRADVEPVAVFFPRFSSAHSTRWFPYMAGASVVEVVEGVAELWMRSEPIDLRRLAHD